MDGRDKPDHDSASGVALPAVAGEAANPIERSVEFYRCHPGSPLRSGRDDVG